MTDLAWNDAFSLVQKEMEERLCGSPLLIREYLSHLAASKGKMLRAACVLTAAMDEKGMICSDAIDGAVALELVHLASLVHDDIMDDSDLRRGQVTLQKKYGKRTAVICGDYLLSMALKTAMRAEKKDEYRQFDLPDYIGRLCMGELRQHIHNKDMELSVFEYFRIISGKTAALFEAAFYGGAIIGGKSKEQAVLYRNFGHYMGMMFQLSDDCIDYESSSEDAKKPVQADFENGVITLPVIYAFHTDGALREEAKAGTLSRWRLTQGIRRCQAISFVEMIMGRYEKKAYRVLDRIDAGRVQEERMRDLIRRAGKRRG